VKDRVKVLKEVSANGKQIKGDFFEFVIYAVLKAFGYCKG